MKEKNVLVTGSSRGIGRACALAFANAGYHVFLNCRTSLRMLEETAEIIRRQGGSCTALPGDVGNPDEVRRIFRSISEQCGGLDVLVNNAGVSYFGLLSDMSDEAWDTVLSTDLSSVFYCCREAVPYMVSEKKGRIINVSSMWGVCGASCEAAYSAAKAGVNGLTRALGRELAPSNVQVNAVAFGMIDTEMNARLTPEELDLLREEIPAGRFGTPEEAAQFILMLAHSPSYLTGQVITFDGAMI